MHNFINGEIDENIIERNWLASFGNALCVTWVSGPGRNHDELVVQVTIVSHEEQTYPFSGKIGEHLGIKFLPVLRFGKAAGVDKSRYVFEGDTSPNHKLRSS